MFNFKPEPVQRMLDFDFMCKRETPSLAGLVTPGSSRGNHKVFWGTAEKLIPVYGTVKEACQAQPNADVFINFASFRRYPVDRLADTFTHDEITSPVPTRPPWRRWSSLPFARSPSSRRACIRSRRTLDDPLSPRAGIPERETRILIATAKAKGKWIIGPATVGGIQVRLRANFGPFRAV